VRDRGRLVLVGLLGGGKATVPLFALMRRRLRLIGSVLRARSRQEKAALVAAFGDFALPAATRYGLLRDSIRLSDLRGKTVVIAFFYKARTKG